MSSLNIYVTNLILRVSGSVSCPHPELELTGNAKLLDLWIKDYDLPSYKLSAEELHGHLSDALRLISEIASEEALRYELHLCLSTESHWTPPLALLADFATLGCHLEICTSPDPEPEETRSYLHLYYDKQPEGGDLGAAIAEAILQVQPDFDNDDDDDDDDDLRASPLLDCSCCQEHSLAQMRRYARALARGCKNPEAADFAFFLDLVQAAPHLSLYLDVETDLPALAGCSSALVWGANPAAPETPDWDEAPASFYVQSLRRGDRTLHCPAWRDWAQQHNEDDQQVDYKEYEGGSYLICSGQVMRTPNLFLQQALTAQSGYVDVQISYFIPEKVVSTFFTLELASIQNLCKMGLSLRVDVHSGFFCDSFDASPTEELVRELLDERAWRVRLQGDSPSPEL